MTRPQYVVELLIHDETANELKDFFLPPEGSHVTEQELRDACERLKEATIELQRLRREGR